MHFWREYLQAVDIQTVSVTKISIMKRQRRKWKLKSSVDDHLRKFVGQWILRLTVSRIKFHIHRFLFVKCRISGVVKILNIWMIILTLVRRVLDLSKPDCVLISLWMNELNTFNRIFYNCDCSLISWIDFKREIEAVFTGLRSIDIIFITLTDKNFFFFLFLLCLHSLDFNLLCWAIKID